jgi:hypothetical protein
MTARGASIELDHGRWHELRPRLETLRAVLECQGSLVRKSKNGRAFWYLRYIEDGLNGRVQRSLYVGDEATTQHVRAWLEEIRAPGAFLRETLRLASLAPAIARLLRRRPGRSGPAKNGMVP